MNMAFNKESTPAQALVACRVCLCLAATEKMYCFETAELKKDYFSITGLEVSRGDGLPQHMCHTCRGLLRKATEFRNKCHSTQKLLSSHPVTLKFLQNIHGQPLQNTTIKIVSGNFDSNLLDLQLNAERDSLIHLNKEKTEENDKYFQSDVQCDIQNHVNVEVRDLTLQLDKKNYIKNHGYKEDPESDLLNSQDDTDIKWATDNNLNDDDQSDGDFTTVVDDELNSSVDKLDDENKSIPFGETKSEETMYIQFTSNDTTVEYSKMLHQYIQEKYVSKSLVPDSLISKRIEFYNFLKQKYDYDGNYMDEVEQHSVHAKKYNFKIEYFRTTKERIENLRARMYTDKYKQAKFKCTDCYTGFASEQKYKEHRERHDSAEHGSFICEVCKQRYSTKSKLGCHRRKVHIKKLTCNQCGESVPGLCIAKLKEHFDSHSSGTKYECEHCPYVATKKASLLQHVYRKHGTMPCTICFFMMSPRGVDRHMKRQHSKTFTCSSCRKVFNAYAAIAKHIHTSAGGVCGADAWPCTKCGRNFGTEGELRVHIDRIHCRRERKQRCSRCEKTYTSRPALLLHNKIKHNLRPHECTICSEKFPLASKLRIHINAVHKKAIPLETQRKIKEKEQQKTFTCSSCNKVFNEYAAIERHIQTSPGGVCSADAWPCARCGENFDTERDLRGHIEGCHKSRPQRTKSPSYYRPHVRIRTKKPFACTECDKTFSLKAYLKQHMTVHTGERAHRCSQCDKTYTSSSALSQHRKYVHENLRPHECTMCSKKFLRVANLRIHLNAVHKILLPLETQRRIKDKKKQKIKRGIICEWCAKPFSSSKDYRAHATLHTGERPHACPECPKTFRSKPGLKYHMLVHTGERAHRCQQCGQTFTIIWSLTHHIKTVHENLRPHECPICSKKFGRSYHLKVHMRNGHRTQPPRDSDGKNNAKGEKKVGGGVKKVGRGVKKVGRGAKRAGRGVKK